MGKILKLCPACERTLSEAYELKKLPRSRAKASYKTEPCGWCGKKCVLMDEFEIGKVKQKAQP